MGKNEFKLANGRTLKVLQVSSEMRTQSNKYYMKAFIDAVSNGYPLKLQVQKMLEEKNLLDQEQEEKIADQLRSELKKLEITLRKGVIDNTRMTKEQGKDIALKMRAKRQKLGELGRSLASYFQETAESIADNERLQYFFYATVVDATNGSKYWDSYDKFKEADRESPDFKIIEKAFFSSLLGNIDIDFEKSFYENQWLIRRGYMNDKLQLIREDGKIIDEEGRLINDNGRLVDENGKFIDQYGNLIDEDGNLLVEDSWENPQPEPSAPNLYFGEQAQPRS